MKARSFFVASAIGFSLSCGGSVIDGGVPDDEGSGTGGQSRASGGGGGAGTGSPAGGSSTGGSGAGRSAGGSGAGASSTGGSSTARTGGDGTGGAPLPHEPVPSSGCSVEEKPSDLAIDVGPIHLSLPPHYGGETPLPLIIGFHPFGTSLSGLVAQDDRQSANPLPERFVIARPRALTTEDATWESLGLDEYDLVYQELESHVCFDESRVFGVASGGGARFLSRMVCEPSVEGIVRPADFQALALNGPLHGVCGSWPSLPLLQIHGEQEIGAVNGDLGGYLALGRFQESKQCSGSSESSYASGIYTCTDFESCTSPLRFCSHDVKLSFLDEWLPHHTVEIDRFFADYL